MGGDRAGEVTRVVPRPAELEERTVELVRARGEPSGLERHLAALDRLAESTLHLEREVLGERQRDDQPTLAERPGDRDPAVGVSDSILVALEVRLGPREVVERLEMRGDLAVRAVRRCLSRLLQVRRRELDPAGSRLGEAQDGRRGRDQRPTTDLAGRRQRGLGHLDRLREIELVQPVHGELDLEHDGFGSRALGQLLPGLAEPAMSLVVTAEPVLDRRAVRRQLDPPRDRVRRKELQRLQQRGPASVELTHGAQRRRERDTHVDLARHVDGGKQAQTRLEPARCRGRARAAAAAPASSISAIASWSPRPAYCSTWWARSAAGAPRSANSDAARACAPSLQPAGADS